MTQLHTSSITEPSSVHAHHLDSNRVAGSLLDLRQSLGLRLGDIDTEQSDDKPSETRQVLGDGACLPTQDLFSGLRGP